MGPDGLVGPDRWDEVLASMPCLPKHPEQPESNSAIERLGREERLAATAERRRQRSPSHDHEERCIIEHGSARRARQQCARCGWIANRERLLRELVYTNSAGDIVPWVAENPDLQGPWGLGCLLCHIARRGALSEKIPVSAFSEFTFGAGTPGLLVQPLVRHGNHGKRQHSQVGDCPIMIDRDEGHDIALMVLPEISGNTTRPTE